MITIEEVKEWLKYCPEAKDVNQDLMGWYGDLGNICSHCAARLLARGVGQRTFLNVPIWINPDIEFTCILCDKKV